MTDTCPKWKNSELTSSSHPSVRRRPMMWKFDLFCKVRRSSSQVEAMILSLHCRHRCAASSSHATFATSKCAYVYPPQFRIFPFRRPVTSISLHSVKWLTPRSLDVSDDLGARVSERGAPSSVSHPSPPLSRLQILAY